jgi:CBS-domain-containing membrane protein
VDAPEAQRLIADGIRTLDVLPSAVAIAGTSRRTSRRSRRWPSMPHDAEVLSLGEVRFPVPVVNDDWVLLGTVDAVAAALPPPTRVQDVMAPAPGTIRPELRIDQVAEQLQREGLDHVLVNAVNGVLLGLVVTDELHF